MRQHNFHRYRSLGFEVSTLWIVVILLCLLFFAFPSHATVNLVGNSQKLDNLTTWTKYGIRTFANNAIAPDGTTTAELFTANSTTTNIWKGLYTIGNITSGNNYTISIYAKKASDSNIMQLTHGTGFATPQYANFNLSDGTILNSTGGWAWISPASNGYYRIGFTARATTSPQNTGINYVVFPANNVTARMPPFIASSTALNATYLWGAQFSQSNDMGDYNATSENTTIFVGAGDSITAGAYTVYNGLNGYLGWLKDSEANWTFFNKGHDGGNTQTLINNFNADVLGTDANIVMFEISNDIVAGYTYEEIIALYNKYNDMCTGNGSTLYFNTIPPRGSFNASQEATRIQLNNYITCNFTQDHGNRYYFDLNATLADPADVTQIRSPYTYDGTHLTDAGYLVWGTNISTDFPNVEPRCGFVPIPTPTPTANVTATPTPVPTAICYNQTGNISLSLTGHSTSSLMWTWDSTANISSISIDGIVISGYEFDNATPWYTVTGLTQSTWHAIRVRNTTDFGRQECITDAVALPFSPIMNPSTGGKSAIIDYGILALAAIGLILLIGGRK